MPCHTYVPCRVVPCRARVLAWFGSPSLVSRGYVCARAQLVSEEKAREMLAEAVELITDDEAISVADGASNHERHDRLSFDQFCLLMLMDDGAPPPDMAHTPALPSPAGFDGAITPTPLIGNALSENASDQFGAAKLTLGNALQDLLFFYLSSAQTLTASDRRALMAITSEITVDSQHGPLNVA